jgi:polyphosphate kinase
VKVELIVRGMCCLRPGVSGVSNNIRVRSIVGRFLEHSRVYWFANNGEDKFYLASADLMERNLDRRVETGFPIEGKKLQSRLKKELELYLSDNSAAWLLRSDGRYTRSQPAANQTVRNVQAQLLEKLCGSGAATEL